MGHEQLDGNVFIGNPDTGEMTPLGWVDGSGLTFEDPEPSPLISQLRQLELSFKITGRTAEKTWRTLVGLAYKHPRQILHNGKKPR